MKSQDLIICTRNRVSTCLQLIERLEILDEVAFCNLIVIENSESDSNFNLLIKHAKKFRKFKSVKIVKSKPGLPTSRNVALSISLADYLTFIDDDVDLPKNFLTETRRFLDSHPEIAGTSPLISGLYQSKLGALFGLLPGRYSGKILPSGQALWFKPGQYHKPREVEWLPGCSMTFRRSHIRGRQFNQKLEKGPLGGYALGEDLDFTWQLSRSYKLLLNPSLMIDHDRSDLNRLSLEADQIAIGIWSGYFAKIRGHRFIFFSLTYEVLRMILAIPIAVKTKVNVTVPIKRFEYFFRELTRNGIIN